MSATPENLATAYGVYAQARREGVEHEAAVTTAMYEVRALSVNELAAYIAGVQAQPSEARSELRRLAAVNGACPICAELVPAPGDRDPETTEAQMVIASLKDETVQRVVGVVMGLPLADVRAAAVELQP